MAQHAMKTVRYTIVSIICLLTVWYFYSPYINRNSSSTIEPQLATILNQTSPIAPFELTDTNGNAFTNQSFRGHWTLMFFGYSTCPDVCPATLSLMKDSWTQFNGNYPAKFVFASINPQADKIPELKSFLYRFHKDFIGITGANQEVAKLSQQLNIVAQRDNSDPNVDRIDHTAALMLIDPRGRLKAIFTPPLDSDAIVADLKLITNYK